MTAGPRDGATDARVAAIEAALLAAADAAGPFTLRRGRSQTGLWRRHPFAAIWRPDRYLHGPVAPVVLSVFARSRLESARWKQVVEPRPGRFTHHLELSSPDEVDAEVAALLAVAAAQAC